MSRYTTKMEKIEEIIKKLKERFPKMKVIYNISDQGHHELSCGKIGQTEEEIKWFGFMVLALELDNLYLDMVDLIEDNWDHYLEEFPPRSILRGILF